MAYRCLLLLVMAASLWLYLPPTVDAVGSFSIYDNMPMTGAVNVPTGLNLSSGQGLTMYYSLSDAAKCRPVESSFNRQTIQVTAADDTTSYHFYTVSAVLNDTTNRAFRLQDVTMIELKPDTTYTLRLTGGPDGIAISCSTVWQSRTYYLDSDYTTSFTTGPDTVPPVISQLTAESKTASATITWSTNQPANSQVAYGISASLGQFSSVATTPTKRHTMTLTQLAPGMVYYYQVLSHDEAGNLATATGQFSTLLISQVNVEEVSGYEAIISWKTNQPTDSMIEYGLTNDYTHLSGRRDDTINHRIKLEHLNPQSTYHFRIKAQSTGGTSYSTDYILETTDVLGNLSTAAPLDVTAEPLAADPLDLVLPSQPQVLAATDDSADLANPTPSATAGATPAATSTALGWSIWLALPFLILLTLIGGMALLLRHQHRIGRIKRDG